MIKIMTLHNLRLISLAVVMLGASNAYADNCNDWLKQVNRADRKLQQGGNSSYLKFWRQSRDSADKKLSQCRKSNGTGEPEIKVYSAQSIGSNTHYSDHMSSDIDNLQLQSLIKTCNYWIDQVNRNSSPENRSFRDNACSDAKAAEQRIINPPETFVMIHKRSAKECVKPNNVIDREVRECMEGKREPTWASQ